MMRDEQNTDLEFREILQDAEVKAPSGVWKAVSSRLDDIDGVAAPERRSGAWLWLCSGLALATLAISLVLTGTFEHRSQPETLAQVQEPEIERSADPVPAQESLTLIQEQFVKSTPTWRPARAVPAAAPVEEVAAETQESAAPVAEVAAEAVEESSAPSQGEPAVETGKREKVAPWQSFDEDVVRKKSFVSLTAGGSLGGNSHQDAQQSSYTSGISGVSSKDNITELSSSVYGIPFSVGVGVKYHFNDKLSIGSGVDYSLLTRSFSGCYTPAGTSQQIRGDVNHFVHYVGVPLAVYYNFLESSLLRLYADLGGQIDFCVGNTYRMVSSGQEFVISEKVDNPQFSVGAGIGLEFKLGPLVSIYLEPGAFYYFYSQQPKSIRTDRPLNFNFDAGVRFNLK